MVSVYPCDVHGRRISGRLDWARITTTRGSGRRTRPLRVCGECLDHIFEADGQRWVELALEDGSPLATVCASCREEVEEASERDGLFVTAYRGGERSDYFAWLCRTCSDILAAKYRLE